MAREDAKQEGPRKAGAGRRSRSGRAGRSNTPRIMVLALLVIVAGGAALFWPRGGGVPTGIGEHKTVVSSPSDTTLGTAPPRSGDVDIADEGAPRLIPEKAEEPTAAKTDSPTEDPPPAARPEPEPEAVKPVTRTETKTQAKPVPRVQPTTDGPWVVQVGAFGEAPNADKEAARLKALGWDARVRAGNNSSGNMVFRVWIGYFASRTEAQTFINQNSRQLGGAYPVHR